MSGPSSSKYRKVDQERRIFQEKWTEEYFFVMFREKPICLICNEAVAVLKEYNLRRHYLTKHLEKYGKVTGQLRSDNIEKLKRNLAGQQNIFLKRNADAESIVRAGYAVSKKLAEHSKPFSEGEFVKECLLEVANILCPENSKKFEQISLSRRTVTRRIDLMAENIKATLSNTVGNCVSFSIALDESTDISDTAQLAIFIRAIDENFTITEELLALQAMKDTTKGKDIFEEIVKVFNAFNLDWAKLNGVTTDGAPAMVGKNIGVVANIKTELSRRKIDENQLLSFHCIIHQEDLCAKTIKFKHVMEVVVSCVNFIKSRGLNHRQFQQFLHDLEAEYGDLIFYCEVRWLSKGKMLMRFYELREEVQAFMEMKGKPELVLHLKNDAWLSDLAFLVDVIGYLNELNRNIQKQGQFVHELFAHIKSFQAKLRLWETQLRSGNTYHFPTLATHKNVDRDTLAEALCSLNTEFTSRFQDFRSREKEFEIFINPFTVNVEQAAMSLQMELIQLQADDVLKSVFRDVPLQDFYKKYIPKDTYPGLVHFVCKIMCLFGSTYCCEQFFSKMAFTKAKNRSRLSDVNLENSLRVATTSQSPDIELLSKQMQSQVSH